MTALGQHSMVPLFYANRALVTPRAPTACTARKAPSEASSHSTHWRPKNIGALKTCTKCVYCGMLVKSNSYSNLVAPMGSPSPSLDRALGACADFTFSPGFCLVLILSSVSCCF